MHVEKCLIATLAGVVLASCAVEPTVEYRIIAGGVDAQGVRNGRQLADDEFDAFYLQGSKIRVELAPAADAAKLKPADVLMKSIPIEYTEFKYALAHDDPFWVTTTVNLTKQSNLDVLSEAGVSVVDHRIEYINTAASIAKTLIGLAGAAEAAPVALTAESLPLEIDLIPIFRSEYLAHHNGRAFSLQDLPTGLTVKVDDIPPEAVETPHSDSFRSHALLYSACRTAHISVNIGTVHAIGTVKVADPNFVQRVNFPPKGKVSLHSECGTSVQTDPASGVSTDAAVAKALVDAAAGLRPTTASSQH